MYYLVCFDVRTMCFRSRYVNGDSYEGCFKDGQRFGHGVYRQGQHMSSIASIYIGEWLQDRRQGYGVQDDILKGEWQLYGEELKKERHGYQWHFERWVTAIWGGVKKERRGYQWPFERWVTAIWGGVKKKRRGYQWHFERWVTAISGGVKKERRGYQWHFERWVTAICGGVKKERRGYQWHFERWVTVIWGGVKKGKVWLSVTFWKVSDSYLGRS